MWTLFAALMQGDCHRFEALNVVFVMCEHTVQDVRKRYEGAGLVVPDAGQCSRRRASYKGDIVDSRSEK